MWRLSLPQVFIHTLKGGRERTGIYNPPPPPLCSISTALKKLRPKPSCRRRRCCSSPPSSSQISNLNKALMAEEEDVAFSHFAPDARREPKDDAISGFDWRRRFCLCCCCVNVMNGSQVRYPPDLKSQSDRRRSIHPTKM